MNRKSTGNIFEWLASFFIMFQIYDLEHIEMNGRKKRDDKAVSPPITPTRLKIETRVVCHKIVLSFFYNFCSQRYVEFLHPDRPRQIFGPKW